MINQLCHFCKIRPATESHHMFSQSRTNRKIYGRKLIDADFNKVAACNHCNGSHANIETWDEQEFRKQAIAAGHELPEGSKTFQMKEYKNGR